MNKNKTPRPAQLQFLTVTRSSELIKSLQNFWKRIRKKINFVTFFLYHIYVVLRLFIYLLWFFSKIWRKLDTCKYASEFILFKFFLSIQICLGQDQDIMGWSKNVETSLWLFTALTHFNNGEAWFFLFGITYLSCNSSAQTYFWLE